MPEFCIICSCCELMWIAFWLQNVVSLDILYPFAQRLNYGMWILTWTCWASWKFLQPRPPLPKVSFNHCVILFCCSACNCLKRPSTAAPIKTCSETETNSSRKDYIQTLIGNQGLSQPSMEVSSILFDFQTLELISQSLQPSQDPAKDPRGTPEHGTSIALRRRPWDFYLSSWIGKVVTDINPTCGVEAELGIRIVTETVLDWTYWKNTTAQWATLHSQKFGKYCQDNNTFSILFINWLSRWAQAKCCQSEKSKTPSLTSHDMNKQQRGTTHETTVYYLKSIFCQIRNLTQ